MIRLLKSRPSEATLLGLVFICGLVAMSVAIALVHPPAGLFFAGACCVVCCVLYARNGVGGGP